MINPVLNELMKLNPPFEFLLFACFMKADKDQQLKLKMAFPKEYQQFLKTWES